MDIVLWLRGLARRRRAAFVDGGMEGCRYDEAADEIARLRATKDSIVAKVALLVDHAGPVTPGCDPQSWGAGFQTAHQMVLNILNGVDEQKPSEK